MKAVVARAAGAFALETLPDPTPPDGGLVLDVEVAGVCAADRMLWRGDGPWDVTFPFTPGHEIVGRVRQLGANAPASVAIGDRVAVEVMVPCEFCLMCLAGRENLCRDGAHFGSDLPGAFAEQMAVTRGARLHLLPEHVSMRNAAGIEMLANAFHAVKRADLAGVDSLAVIGIGAIGATVVKLVRVLHPAVKVSAVVRQEVRVERALALGAHEAIVLDPSDPDGGLSRIRSIADDCGPARIIDVSGSVEAVQIALNGIRPGGRLCLYGVYRKKLQIDLNLIAEFKELEVVGGHLAPDGAFAKAIELLSACLIDLEDVVAAPIPLASFENAIQENHGLKTAIATGFGWTS